MNVDLARNNPLYANLSYVHPAFVALALLAAFFVFSRGMKQRDQRVRRKAAPAGNLKQHVAVGPWAVLAVGLGAVGGAVSTVVLRGWKLFGTTHGWLGAGATVGFAGAWWLGRRLLAQQKQLAAAHGYVSLAALALGGLALLTGIALLP